MSEYTIKYPLDLTGEAPANRIEGEPHVLAPGLNRSLVPRYGAFYTDGLVVRDADTTEILTPNDQYIPIMYHAEASERSGKEVCAGIIVTDGTVSDNVLIDYQVVGDVYQNLTQVILDLIENLNLDEREVMWGDLLGRPDAFPPAHHLHDIGDIFGFEYLVQAVNDLRDAVLYGDVASHDELKAMIEDRRQELQGNIDTLRGEYEEHRDRTDNPHSVTKAQVGLGSVANHPLASQAEAVAGELNSRYMTPLRVAEAMDVVAVEPLNEHKADYNNPHRVTKAQVGLGSVENHPLSTQTQAEEGTDGASYMTPVRVKQAVDVQALAPLTAHTDRTDNPHQVTKAQVGLSLVPNFPAASQAEAETGEVNNRFMTPLRVAQAIDIQAGNLLQAHVDDKTNPHEVTKAQVGLGSVLNYGMSNQSEAEAGQTNTKYMSPLRVAQAIDAQAGVALRAHVNDTTNPHQVTKAQVGLGNVTNDRQVARAGDTMTGDLNFAQTGRGITWSMNTDEASIRFYNTADGDTDSRLEFQTGDNNNEYFRWTHLSGTGLVEYMRLDDVGLTVANRVTASAFYGDGRNLTGMVKAQVGLGSVDNFATASQTEAEQGLANNRFMTPLRVAQAITEQAGTLLQQHVDDKTNPHQVTKAQVGLSQVPNWPAATLTDVQNGTANHIVSPSVLKQHLDPRFTQQTLERFYESTQFDSGANDYVAVINNIYGDTAPTWLVHNQAKVDRKYVLNLTPEGDGTTFLTADRTFRHQIIVPQAEYDAWLKEGTKATFELTGASRINAGITARFELYIATENLGATHTGPAYLVAVQEIVGTGVAASVGQLDTVVYEDGTFIPYVSTEIQQHAQSGDHDARYDARYVKNNANEEASVRSIGGNLEAYVNGAWRIVWPPQWQ